MRAAVFYGRRDVRVEDVQPSPPGRGEVRIDVDGRRSAEPTPPSTFTARPSSRSQPAPRQRSHRPDHSGSRVRGADRCGRRRRSRVRVGDRVVCGAGVSCGNANGVVPDGQNLCASYYTIGLHTTAGSPEQVVVPAGTCVPFRPGATREPPRWRNRSRLRARAREGSVQPGCRWPWSAWAGSGRCLSRRPPPGESTGSSRSIVIHGASWSQSGSVHRRRSRRRGSGGRRSSRPPAGAVSTSRSRRAAPRPALPPRSPR